MNLRRCFRLSRGARGPIAHGGSRPPLLSVASGANRRRRALPSACPSLTIDAAGPAGYHREPSARLPPRAAQSVPPPPVFSTSPDASGDGEPNLLGSVGPQSLSLSGGAHLMHQLLPWGKLVWLFSNSCLHRMHVFVAPSIGCVSSVVVVCASLQPIRLGKTRASRDANLRENLPPRYRRSRQISEPPDSRTRIAELALERWRARRGSR